MAGTTFSKAKSRRPRRRRRCICLSLIAAISEVEIAFRNALSIHNLRRNTMFNDTTQAAMGAPATLPHNSPGSYAAIARGATQIQGGSGAVASAAEPVDQAIAPVDAFPAVPVPPRDPWQIDQDILPISEWAGPGPTVQPNTSPAP